jgi:hypothetical protein
MPDINRASDPSNMIWKLIDRQTGAENGAISWAFDVGDRVKMRLVNEMESDHPMHHPCLGTTLATSIKRTSTRSPECCRHSHGVRATAAVAWPQRA